MNNATRMFDTGVGPMEVGTNRVSAHRKEVEIKMIRPRVVGLELGNTAKIVTKTLGGNQELLKLVRTITTMDPMESGRYTIADRPSTQYLETIYEQ